MFRQRSVIPCHAFLWSATGSHMVPCLLQSFQIIHTNETSRRETPFERQWMVDATAQLHLARLAASEAKRHVDRINNPRTSSTRSVFLQDIDTTVALVKTFSCLLPGFVGGLDITGTSKLGSATAPCETS